jgi:hypothetical protein
VSIFWPNERKAYRQGLLDGAAHGQVWEKCTHDALFGRVVIEKHAWKRPTPEFLRILDQTIADIRHDMLKARDRKLSGRGSGG